MDDVIELGLGNYYGNVRAYEEDGDFYLSLDDYSGTRYIKISEDFFKAIQKEFGDK